LSEVQTAVRRDAVPRALDRIGDSGFLASGSIQCYRGCMADILDNPETRAGVESHADTLGGEPCLTGTRIPAYDVAALMRDCGLTEVHRAFPSLTQAEIDTAVAFAAAVPRTHPRPRTVIPGKPHARGTVTIKRV
jgi:uncharacterized protein (DUF433 family)